MAHHVPRPFDRALILLLAAALLPYIFDLGGSTIWDANEAYYVETPREMLESGDYINPTFNYEPRFNKPVLSYWVVAGLYQVFGVSVAVQRAAIAAAALVMIAACFLLARAAWADRQAAVLAAIGLAAGPRFFMFSRRILIDLLTTSAMTLTLLFFVLSERYPARRRTFLLLMYATVGVGVLTKGPVAAVLPAAAFLIYLGVHREWRRVSAMMLPQGIVIVLAIAAPWYAMLYAQHGWTHITQFFIGENLARYTSVIGVQSRGPLFYLPVIFTDALPWSFALVAAIAAWRVDRRTESADPGVRVRTLLLIWVAVIVGFFSLSQTKQDLYILPVAPAVAVLGGGFIARAVSRGRAGDERWLAGTLTALALLLLALSAFVLYVFVVSGTTYALDGAIAVGLMAGVAGAFTLVLSWRRALASAVLCTVAVLVAFNWVLVLRVLPDFERYKPALPLSTVIAERAEPGDVVLQYNAGLPSMVFYLRRHVDMLEDDGQFIEAMQSGKPVFAVLPADRYEALKATLAIDTCVLARQPTSDVRLRSVLAREPPPEVVLVSTRCPS